jgi:hypothetical protein
MKSKGIRRNIIATLARESVAAISTVVVVAVLIQFHVCGDKQLTGIGAPSMLGDLQMHDPFSHGRK